MHDHFKEINRYSNIINLIVYSIIFGSVIAVVDYFDVISIYCLDDFEPWEYGSNEALLTSMYNTIIKKAGIKYDVLRVRKILKSINSIIADNSLPGKIANELLPVNSMSVSEVKTHIESFLIKNNKQIVFFIDNIDRTDSENIIFLFKLIGTIFDISNITFVLAYDKKRLDLIFKDSLNIDSNYTEKIIQQVITVPNVRSEPLREVIDTCFKNIMTYYGINVSEIKKYSMLSKFYSSSITNLRQFKRLINSVFYPVFKFSTGLCYYDLLVLETIKFFNYDIYRSIYDNKNFFISNDRSLDSDLFGGSINKEPFNKEAKEYFDGLKKYYSDSMIELLASVFPYVKNYQNNQPVKQDYVSNEDVFKPAPRVYSAKYFDLYFSFSKNDFLNIKHLVDFFLCKINETSSSVFEISQYMCSLIKENDPYFFREFVTQFYSRVSEINISRIYKVIEVFHQNIYSFFDVYTFLGLSTFNYFGLINADLLKMCNQDEFEKFVNSITYSYEKLNHLRNIIYWFEKSHNTQTDDNRFSVLKEKYDSLCNVITAKNIDLYDNEYYHRHNAYGLFGSYNTLTDEKRKKYFKAIISAINIYRVLGDIISCSIGSKYAYRYEKQNIEEFGINIETINKLLENNPPKNNSEQFILEVYDKFLNNSGGDRENMEVYRDSEFIFEL